MNRKYSFFFFMIAEGHSAKDTQIIGSDAPAARRPESSRPSRVIFALQKMVLAAAAILLFCGTACAFQADGANQGEGQRILIAFFSLSGNTRLIARDIQEMTGGDLFEIRPVRSYGPDFESTVEQARKELAEKARPLLKDAVADFEGYDVIFVGFPNWVGTMPMPVFSFLEQYDFSGKTIVPFCTHGTSGPASTFRDLAALPLHAVILEGLAVYRNDVPHAEARVREWLHNLGYLKQEAR